ncbi:MAG: hypothetical protein F9K24_12035 [Leptonema illini]|jgi:hypothetical protein|uniref:Uncharacterized protein n=2 Tax=Leptonema illini TaxID=183 RepID=H2CDX4_9LEPT|nr:hypothetical protein [Leptonema illini]EHQ05493.1 hypothetical protein Lepil_0792 [Leptonema illini DSM 21528]KAB2932007.1 MAG: hypothetical protein F9K24_12035 [Leptonema illini]
MKRLALLLFILFAAAPLYAFGTYGEGKAYVLLRESGTKGIFIKSYEGLFEIATYDDGEKCAEEDQCFTPQKEELRFSVRLDNKDVIQFMQKNLDRMMIVEYRIHRIKPVSLSTGFEVLKAYPVQASHGPDFPWKYVSKVTGSSETSVYGKILRLEYRGTAVGTYEGLLYDRRLDKVRPFSVTDEAMARHIYQCMDAQQEYNIGLSRSITTALEFRESKYDVFEINYRERASSVE